MEDTCKELLLAICIGSVLTWRHGGHVGGANYSLGIELYFYANSFYCFIMQI